MPDFQQDNQSTHSHIQSFYRTLNIAKVFYSNTEKWTRDREYDLVVSRVLEMIQRILLLYRYANEWFPSRYTCSFVHFNAFFFYLLYIFSGFFVHHGRATVPVEQCSH